MKAVNIVLGLGRSGISASRLLNAEGEKVVVLEKYKNNKLNTIAKQLNGEGIEVMLGKDLDLKSLTPWVNSIKTVIVSPGISWNNPTLIELRNQGIDVQGEMAIAWQRLKHLKWVGITGTNGKTTVTYMLNHILETNGIKAPMGGNMGHPVTSIAHSQLDPKQVILNWLIIELSSYQIEAAPQISPEIGIWTTFSPDHLERHGSIDNYRKIKRKLLERSRLRIFNGDDPELKNERKSWDNGLWISTNGPGTTKYPSELWINSKGVVIEKNQPLFPASVLNIPGQHNLQNMLLATAAARKIGVSANRIHKSLSSFKGIDHRLEIVDQLNGVIIINDSKATNYESATIGLKSINSPAIILAGGVTKKGDPSDWLVELKHKASAIVLFGIGASELKQLVQRSNYCGHIWSCSNLKEAVIIALKLSKEIKAKTILLSPACSSFDQYQDFEERGNHFKELINLHLN